MAPQDSKIALEILQSVNNRTQNLRKILRMVITDIVINTPLGRVTRHPAGMHCPWWDDAFVSSFTVKFRKDLREKLELRLPLPVKSVSALVAFVNSRLVTRRDRSDAIYSYSSKSRQNTTININRGDPSSKNRVIWPRFVRAASAFCIVSSQKWSVLFSVFNIITLTPCFNLTSSFYID